MFDISPLLGSRSSFAVDKSERPKPQRVTMVKRSVARPELKPKVPSSRPTTSASVPHGPPNAEGMYQLGPRTYRTLKNELDNIMFKVEQDLPELVDLTSEGEKDIVERWKNEMGDNLKDVLGLNVTKRLLNIFNPFNVKVHFTTKPDRKYLSTFLKRYNFVAFKRLPGVVNTFAAQVKTIADFDALCTAKSVHCGAAKITITPFYRFTQCPKKIKTVFCNPEYMTCTGNNDLTDKVHKTKNDTSIKSEDAEKSSKTNITKEKPTADPVVNKTTATNNTLKVEGQKTETKVTTPSCSKTSTLNVGTNKSKVETSTAKEETPIQKVQTPKPKVEIPKPKVEIPKPKVETPKPKVETPKPKSDPPKPNVVPPKPKIESTEPKLKTPTPKVEAPKPKVDTPTPIAKAPNTKAVTPAPKSATLKTVTPISNTVTLKPKPANTQTTAAAVETSKPKVDTPKPKVETEISKVETAKPKVDTPKPKVDTPKPKVDTPKPKVDTPKPKIDTPKPKVDTPKPKVEPAKAVVSKTNIKVDDKTKNTGKVAVQTNNTANVKKATPAKIVAKTAANPNTKITKSAATTKNVPAKKTVFPNKKATKKVIEKDDYEELDDHDILALISEGIVLDECSGSDEN